jgi:hypothetical protein
MGTFRRRDQSNLSQQNLPNRRCPNHLVSQMRESPLEPVEFPTLILLGLMDNQRLAMCSGPLTYR